MSSADKDFYSSSSSSGFATLSSAAPSAPPPSTSSHTLLNKRVKISGFSARPEVNNNIGVISGFDAATETFTVELDGFKGTVNGLRVANLDDPFKSRWSFSADSYGRA